MRIRFRIFVRPSAEADYSGFVMAMSSATDKFPTKS
jgi:hypothetical protein